MAPADALPAAQEPRTPERNARWNFRWAALCGALFECGAAFVETGTVVAAFLGRLTPSPVAVGAAESVARVGWLLPQILVANYAQGLRYRKPIYLIAGWGRAACLGFLAGLLLVWPDAPRAIGSELVLAAFFVLWTAFSLVSGLAGVPYNDIIGRTVPSNRRSRLLAGRAFVGGSARRRGGLGDPRHAASDTRRIAPLRLDLRHRRGRAGTVDWMFRAGP